MTVGWGEGLARLPKTLPPLVPSLVTSLPEVDKTHLEYSTAGTLAPPSRTKLTFSSCGGPPPPPPPAPRLESEMLPKE